MKASWSSMTQSLISRGPPRWPPGVSRWLEATAPWFPSVPHTSPTGPKCNSRPRLACSCSLHTPSFLSYCERRPGESLLSDTRPHLNASCSQMPSCLLTPPHLLLMQRGGQQVTDRTRSAASVAHESQRRARPHTGETTRGGFHVWIL